MSQFRKRTRNEMESIISRQNHTIEQDTRRIKAALFCIEELNAKIAKLEAELAEARRAS